MIYSQFCLMKHPGYYIIYREAISLPPLGMGQKAARFDRRTAKPRKNYKAMCFIRNAMYRSWCK